MKRLKPFTHMVKRPRAKNIAPAILLSSERYIVPPIPIQAPPMMEYRKELSFFNKKTSLILCWEGLLAGGASYKSVIGLLGIGSRFSWSCLCVCVLLVVV